MYINRLDKDTKLIETVDQKDDSSSMWDYRQLLSEYQLSDNTAQYYISQRCCKDWNK